MAEALLITGTVGVGKTSVADAAGDVLSDAGVPNAVIDVDPQSLDWHLERAGELASILDAAQVEDYTVDAGAGSPAQVAALVVKGWGV
ncbi:hypothetical protein [Nonomuraea sp. B5E05]|uniref:hypothetical protein n=1 Tax=Nonomuraea sp. B5E05 TaxID=3153569 RepID=UPI00325FE75D